LLSGVLLHAYLSCCSLEHTEGLHYWLRHALTRSTDLEVLQGPLRLCAPVPTVCASQEAVDLRWTTKQAEYALQASATACSHLLCYHAVCLNTTQHQAPSSCTCQLAPQGSPSCPSQPSLSWTGPWYLHNRGGSIRSGLLDTPPPSLCSHREPYLLARRQAAGCARTAHAVQAAPPAACSVVRLCCRMRLWPP
jgi:hypothetical protein